MGGCMVARTDWQRDTTMVRSVGRVGASSDNDGRTTGTGTGTGTRARPARCCVVLCGVVLCVVLYLSSSWVKTGSGVAPGPQVWAWHHRSHKTERRTGPSRKLAVMITIWGTRAQGGGRKTTSELRFRLRRNLSWPGLAWPATAAAPARGAGGTTIDCGVPTTRPGGGRSMAHTPLSHVSKCGMRATFFFCPCQVSAVWTR